MNEQRQELYKQLVNQLLNCPPGEEINLLQANRDLVDLGLFYTIAQTANYFTTQNDSNTAARLNDLNRELIAANGFNSLDEMDGAYFNCLMSIVKAVEQNPTPEAVYPLFHRHLDKLDLNLAWVLQFCGLRTLGNAEPQLALAIARIISNLAWIIQEFPQGNIANNLEIAIIAYGLVSTVFTEQDFPQYWAMTQNNLAGAYSDRIRADRAQNLERAINCYLQALRVYTERDFPQEWTMTQQNLAIAYQNRIQGDKAENLERAIDCSQLVLLVRTEQDFPQEWAMSQNNLGTAYQNRIQGDKAENLERAIDCCHHALRVYTEWSLPQKWAMIQHNLGTAYRNRIRGDQAQNLERAIGCYRQALKVRTEVDFPHDWAMTQGNLAVAYSYRIRGDQAQNLERAINCSLQALRVRTERDFPLDWAMTQHNLAIAYQNRIQGDKAENLERAIDCYQQALRMYAELDFQDWGITQNNLAGAYGDRIQGDKAENLERAINCSLQALRVRTERDFPLDWAMTQHNLGIAYKNRIRGDEAENLERAIDCYHQALRVHTPESDPFKCLSTARNLGDLALTNANWALAINAYDQAITAIELSRSWAMDDDRRQEIIAESIEVYMNMVQACINDGDVKKAIEYADRARSKQLVDLMATNDLYRGGDIPADMQTYLSQYEHLQTRIDFLRRSGESSDNRALATTETQYRDGKIFQASMEEIQQLEAEKVALWRQIRRLDPILAGQIRVDPISFTQIQQLIDNNTTAILSFYTTRNDTYIFILYRDLPPQIYTLTGEGIEKLHGEFIANNWLNPYFNDDFGKWQQNIPNFLQELAQRLQIDRLIEGYLAGIEELIIIPHLYLHQMPFAALPIANPSKSTLASVTVAENPANPIAIATRDGRGMVVDLSVDRSPSIAPTPCLGDRFRVRVVPSCQILSYCHQNQTLSARSTQAIGIVENATGDLPYTAYECETLATLYNIPSSHRLQSGKATATAFRQLAKEVPILHSSHHAAYDPQNPLGSQLFLSDRAITLAEILTWRIPSLTDLYLNNCETNFSINKITDDLLTISTGFLCVGAKNVVSTLWKVEDCASALIAIFYYEFRQAGSSRSRALQQAQHKLRYLTGAELKTEYYQQLKDHLELQLSELKGRAEVDENTVKKIQYQTEKGLLDRCHENYPFANPYYWAGFISQGLA
jgi:CHAT domain-containing protein